MGQGGGKEGGEATGDRRSSTGGRRQSPRHQARAQEGGAVQPSSLTQQPERPAEAASPAPVPQGEDRTSEQVAPKPRAPAPNAAAQGSIATIIRYAGDDEHKPSRVQVCGSFTGWEQKIDLHRSSSGWATSVTLPPGKHHFFFLLDGTPQVDKRQQVVRAGPQGVANTLSVASKSILREDSMEDTHDGGGGTYARERKKFDETRKFPPLFPPHLRFTPLNAPISQGRVQEAVVATQSLPQPYLPTINHLYFQAREGYSVVGTTHRHEQKYSTVVYYKARSAASSAPPPEPPPCYAVGRTDSCDDGLIDHMEP
eukprot:Hpha_TRINITY_DN17482_c0_g1::TRINITY_DN17482_c0_g1_i1::g.85743::m.85743/K07199/PRKAB; 5'-AMP-activated protein kinase, regulatory beta subunit